MTTHADIVLLPDAGPLITLAYADALQQVLNTFQHAGFAAAAAIGGIQARAQGQGSQLVCG